MPHPELCSLDHSQWDGNRIMVQIVNTLYIIIMIYLKFDESDPILGSNNGELSCIVALITGYTVEFNLRADHGLHELVRGWLLKSTAPVFE